MNQRKAKRIKREAQEYARINPQYKERAIYQIMKSLDKLKLK